MITTITKTDFHHLLTKQIDKHNKKEGCEVILNRDSRNTYVGSTGIKTCPSELRGASYASSKVSITERGMVSWDQGFNKDNIQVWGATKGGYVFDKKR